MNLSSLSTVRVMSLGRLAITLPSHIEHLEQSVGKRTAGEQVAVEDARVFTFLCMLLACEDTLPRKPSKHQRQAQVPGFQRQANSLLFKLVSKFWATIFGTLKVYAWGVRRKILSSGNCTVTKVTSQKSHHMARHWRTHRYTKHIPWLLPPPYSSHM